MNHNKAPLYDQPDHIVDAALATVDAPATGPDSRSWLHRTVIENPFFAKMALTAAFAGVGTGAGLAAAGSSIGGGEATAAASAPATPGTETVTTETMVSRGLVANASDVATKHVVIGESEHIKIDKKTAKQCVETKGSWTNSVKLANGSIYYYTETTPAKLCRDKYSPTGWVKRGGGASGLDCSNIAKPGEMPKAHNNVEVLNVNKLNTAFHLIAKVRLSKSVACPGVTGNGYVFGEVNQTLSLKDYLKMTGKGERKLNIKIADRASVKAHLGLHCTSKVVTKTTTTTTPETTGTTPPPTTSTETVPTTTTKTTTTTNTTTTPPPAQYPPVISMENMPSEGGFVGDSPMQICAEATSNPTSDGVEVSFKDSNNNTLSATYPDPNGDPNSYCVQESAPAAPQTNDQVIATAIDLANSKSASASTNQYPWRASVGF